MDAQQAIKDELARLRFERDDWQQRATAARKEATEHRARRDFLAALKADSRAREYRGYVKQWQDAIAVMKGRVICKRPFNKAANVGHVKLSTGEAA